MCAALSDSSRTYRARCAPRSRVPPHPANASAHQRTLLRAGNRVSRVM
jgi:hypothetical protein